MQQKSDLAIVLKAFRFEERDQIVTAITENHGKLTVLAKNSIQSKRFGGTLELFVASEWNYSEKPDQEMGWLTSTKLRRNFGGIHKSLEALGTASLFSEVLLKITHAGLECQGLFKLHSQALSLLDEGVCQTDLDFAKLRNAYFARILKWHGTAPNLTHCSQCQKPFFDANSFFLNAIKASWSCESCHRANHAVSGVFEVKKKLMEEFFLMLENPLKQAFSYLRTSQETSLTDQTKLTEVLFAMIHSHIPGLVLSELKSLPLCDIKSECSSSHG